MDIKFRAASSADLTALVTMLANDQLGAAREDASSPLNPKYLAMFEEIENDLNNELMVVELEGQVIGMLQLTFIPYLTHLGSWRCLIEGVRVHEDFRGRGIGEKMFRFAIERAKERGCPMVQLTSNKQRAGALKFYQRLGFEASHEGFKLSLAD